jgi:hypothetical protein
LHDQAKVKHKFLVPTVCAGLDKHISLSILIPVRIYNNVINRAAVSFFRATMARIASFRIISHASSAICAASGTDGRACTVHCWSGAQEKEITRLG